MTDALRTAYCDVRPVHRVLPPLAGEEPQFQSVSLAEAGLLPLV